MRSVKDGWRRLRTMTRLGSIEQGLDEEIRFHIDRQTEKNIRLGMTPDEAPPPRGSAASR
jgi:hypothetical protein